MKLSLAAPARETLKLLKQNFSLSESESGYESEDESGYESEDESGYESGLPAVGR